MKALHAQINPHFLFNSLNALYGTIPRTAEGARRTVLNLADVFRYFLQTGGTTIPLSEELRIVKAYLEIEQLRLGDRLQVNLDIDPAALSVLVPPLCIQPLVENGIRHGVAAKPGPGAIAVLWQNMQTGPPSRCGTAATGSRPIRKREAVESVWTMSGKG